MEWLRLACVYHAISGGQQCHILFQCSSLKCMYTGSRSCSRYIMLSVRFEDGFLCSTNRNQLLFDMLVTLASADKCGFLQKCLFWVQISGQNGHREIVPWYDFAFECEYTANEFVDKRGTN